MKLAVAAALVMAAAAVPSSATAAPKTYTIVINQLKFGPAPAVLHVGDTIVWVNRDLFLHNATARDGSFKVELPPGKSGKTVLRRAGGTAFYCTYHPGMKGTLNVHR